MPRLADDPGTPRLRGLSPAALQNEITERGGAQVDFQRFGEAAPAGILKHVPRHPREMVAPMALVSRREHAAAERVAAGSHGLERLQQPFPDGNQRSAHGDRARLHPKHRLRAAGDCEELLQTVGIQFVNEMTDHQQRRSGLELGDFDRDFRKRLFCLPNREMGRRLRAIPAEQLGRCMPLGRQPGRHAPARDSRSASVIQHWPVRRRPTALAEFRQHGIPFPADAFGEREVVALQLAMGSPVVRRTGGGAIPIRFRRLFSELEEPFPETA